MKNDETKAAEYWERAGEVGYAKAMYTSEEVAYRITRRLWNVAVDIGKEMELRESARVLDLGCGDGAFANLVLAKHFGEVDGLDLSEAGILRAKAEATKPEMHFEACDITAMDLSTRSRYDGVFLIGILHHVKAASPAILRGLRKITDRVIVLEPNGNNLMRKLLEFTPAYRSAGEDSFRTRQMEKMFEEAGFQKVIWQRRNLCPNFTPQIVFKTLAPFERIIESTPVVRALCTVNMWGFRARD
jgi:cyclopropane fatty-acyl-phospholipid synthase-like methyltransferase